MSSAKGTPPISFAAPVARTLASHLCNSREPIVRISAARGCHSTLISPTRRGRSDAALALALQALSRCAVCETSADVARAHASWRIRRPVYRRHNLRADDRCCAFLELRYREARDAGAAVVRCSKIPAASADPAQPRNRLAADLLRRHAPRMLSPIGLRSTRAGGLACPICMLVRT